MSLTIACLNAQNYLGRGIEYVQKLYSMCQRHIPEPHRFVCLTDDATGYPPQIETRLLKPNGMDFNGYWFKVLLFKPGMLSGRVLYLDLDLVISDDLTGLIALLDDHDGPWMIDDPIFPTANPRPVEKMGPKLLGLIGGRGTYNSSVMLWRGEVAPEVYTRFRPEATQRLLGDQNWITECLGARIQRIPDGWVSSFKEGGCGPILSCHGSPKPHEIGGPWLQRHWR